MITVQPPQRPDSPHRLEPEPLGEASWAASPLCSPQDTDEGTEGAWRPGPHGASGHRARSQKPGAVAGGQAPGAPRSGAADSPPIIRTVALSGSWATGPRLLPLLMSRQFREKTQQDQVPAPAGPVRASCSPWTGRARPPPPGTAPGPGTVCGRLVLQRWLLSDTAWPEHMAWCVCC